MTLALILTIVTGLVSPAGARPPCDPRSILKAIVEVQRPSSVRQLLDEGIDAISKNETLRLPAISKRLVSDQAIQLRKKAVLFRVDSEGRWLDIVPVASGSPLNQLAFELNSKKGAKHLLRYFPEMLFDDAYSYNDRIFSHAHRALYLSHQDVWKAEAMSEYYLGVVR